MDFEFAQGVDGGGEAIGHGVIIHDFDSIQIEAVGGVAGAVGGGGSGATGRVGLADGAASTTDGDGAGSSSLYARNELGELDKITSVQGQIDDFRGVDDGSDSGVFGLQQGRFAGDANGIGDVTEAQDDVDTGGLIDLEHDVVDLVSLEAFFSYCDAIISGCQERQRVRASTIGTGFTNGVGGEVKGPNFCVGDGTANGIGNRSKEATGVLLRREGRNSE